LFGRVVAFNFVLAVPSLKRFIQPNK